MLTVVFIFGIFGAIIGSFLNVVILRHGARGINGRSECMHCGHTLAWYDLVPILSWAFLRGKCRYCKAHISAQYPIVEGVTAASFALIGSAHLSPFVTIISLIVAAYLIIIAVYDLRHTIIPDDWVWAFNTLALITALVSAFSSPFSAFDFGFWTILAGPIVALPLFALWAISRGTWMGFGDVKLSLGIGWLLGTFAGLQAIFLAFIVGALVSVPLVFFTSSVWTSIEQWLMHRRTIHKYERQFTMKSEVPFGPFLILATALVWLLGMYGFSIPYLL